MKLIYVASPFAGDVEANIVFAQNACKEVIKQGHAFFAPHLLYPTILDDNIPEERQAGINMGIEMLSRCDELWVFGSIISRGMQAEINEAERIGMPIRHCELQPVFRFV